MAITINGSSGISGVDGSAGTPALRGSDSNSGFIFAADQVSTVTGGVSRATVDSSGYLRLVSNGIQFNGDTAAANALDDYEEGTWTPVAVNYSGSISVNRAQYCKVGRTVFFQCYISVGSNSDGDPIIFSGLPYPNNFGGSNDSWNPLMATTNRSGFGNMTGRVQAGLGNDRFEVKTQSGDTSYSFADFSGYWVIAAGTYMTSS